MKSVSVAFGRAPRCAERLLGRPPLGPRRRQAASSVMFASGTASFFFAASTNDEAHFENFLAWSYVARAHR
jgi:hypothetical protein